MFDKNNGSPVGTGTFTIPLNIRNINKVKESDTSIILDKE
jgi:hypothetical protein